MLRRRIWGLARTEARLSPPQAKELMRKPRMLPWLAAVQGGESGMHRRINVRVSDLPRTTC